MAFKEWVTVAEVTETWGVGQGELDDWVRDYKIKTRMKSGVRQLNVSDLNALKAEKSQQFGIPDFEAKNKAGVTWLSPQEMGTAVDISTGDITRLIYAYESLGVTAAENALNEAIKTLPRTKKDDKVSPYQIPMTEANRWKNLMAAKFSLPDIQIEDIEADVPIENPESLSGAARELGMTMSGVVDLLEEGYLVGKKVGGDWQIAPGSMSDLRMTMQDIFNIPDILPTDIPSTQTLSTKNVADVFGVSTGEVTRWIAEGKLEGEMVGGSWQVPFESVSAFKEQALAGLEAIPKFGETAVALQEWIPERQAREALGLDWHEMFEASAALQSEVREGGIMHYSAASINRLAGTELFKAAEAPAQADLYLYSAVDKPWVTPGELGAATQLGTGTVQSWISQGLIKYETVGEEIRISRREAERVLKERYGGPPAPYAGEAARQRGLAKFGPKIVKDYVSPGEIAQTFDVSNEEVEDWLKEGRIRGEKVDGKWRVGVEEANLFRQQRIGELTVQFSLPAMTAPADITKTWVSEADVADMFKTDVKQVTRWVYEGRLAGTESGGKWQIDIFSLNRFKNEMLRKWTADDLGVW